MYRYQPILGIFDIDTSNRFALLSSFISCLILGSLERIAARGFGGHYDEPGVAAAFHYLRRAIAGGQQGHVQALC